MEDWVHRALARWPNVPALYGWLRLDRRGRWLIRGEIISRPQIIDTINRNYEADAQGRWYFQNGPQRGYITLDYTPLILRVCGADQHLETHTGLPVTQAHSAWLDQEGSLLLDTEHGFGLLSDADLPWALQRLTADDAGISEQQLADALALPSGARTPLSFHYADRHLPLTRIDVAEAPARFGYVREPQPETDLKPEA